jgi:thiol:disulfide interchange protein DsbD
MARFFKVLALALLVCGIPAAAEDELLPVTEAFRYVVTDTGSAFEIDWSIYEHAYLYRSRLGFESGTPAIVLGEPVLPEGIDHEDEFFGRQQIYRDFFFVTIPYTVVGERPESAELIIKSQGCDDNIGLCYPPQAWTETVTLKSGVTERPKLELGQLGGDPAAGFPPAEEVFIPEIFAVDGNAVDLGIRITPGFYLYKDKLSVRTLTSGTQAGRWDLPRGTMKTDEYFGEMEVYLDSFLAELAISRATPDAMDVEIELGYPDEGAQAGASRGKRRRCAGAAGTGQRAGVSRRRAREQDDLACDRDILPCRTRAGADAVCPADDPDPVGHHRR